MDFNLISNYQPIEEQVKAVNQLAEGYSRGQKYQVLLGVTGSGKTYTIAHLITKLQLPTLIISHNKTLAAQLYGEFQNFFPQNAVSYFVSYYDYYQPEAYIPSTDTYIEKDADINETIDKLRLSATSNLLSRPDNIVVASVSAIYNIGSPANYQHFVLPLKVGEPFDPLTLSGKLTGLMYERSDFGFHRGTFRLRGNYLDVFLAYGDQGLRITSRDGKIHSLNLIDPISGEVGGQKSLSEFTLYPAKHFITTPDVGIISQIKADMERQVVTFEKAGKIIEAHRIKQKVTYDLEMIREFGYVKGIENYSRYFDGRSPGDLPYSLLDYFEAQYGNRWLLVLDESHISIPQVRGMYFGDLSRKQTLIDYGFRLPSALDNRPLKWNEFITKAPNFIAVSATPSDYEIDMAGNRVVKQLVRPTGILDPVIEIKPTTNQIADIISQIEIGAKKGERTLVTTLTKKMAEDIATHLRDKGIKAHYLHSDVKTLERTEILDDLRNGTYDALIGINLLREGLDLPEVGLVAILDADKEGFLRSSVTLVQTMGRAARNAKGRVIMYADLLTGSIASATKEVEARRAYQLAYNQKHHITPQNIVKPIRDRITPLIELEEGGEYQKDDLESLTPMDRKKVLTQYKTKMREAAQNMDFEGAIYFRDKIKELDVSS